MNKTDSERMPEADSDLVVRIRKGDPEAARQLAESYGEPLRRIISVQLRKYRAGQRKGASSHGDPFRSEVHSLFNQAFIHFVERMKHGNCDLKDHQIIPYMVRIATNLLATKLRRPESRHAWLSESSDMPSWRDSPVDDLVEERELAAKYQSLLAKLPDKCQRLIEGRIKDGKSFAELGEFLGMPENSVRARYSECLEKLRDMGGDS
ncbi:MAG: sigma factor [Planctomycetota bacterium]|jgi:RNA polymerase sigma factor (sigma-70 family)